MSATGNVNPASAQEDDLRNPLVRMNDRLLRLIARACRQAGQQPYVYVVRDTRVIHNDKGYWNPLDLNRHDVYDILAKVDHHISIHSLTETEPMEDYEQKVSTNQVKVTATLWRGSTKFSSIMSGTRSDVQYNLCMAVVNAAASLDMHLNPNEAIYLPD